MFIIRQHKSSICPKELLIILLGVIAVQHDTYSCVALKEDRNYRAQNPNDRVYYLCQYSDSLCNSENDIRLTNDCVRPSDDDRAWHDARNQCLKNGGDLAVLTDADLDILRGSNKLNSVRSYWIGLRRSAWYWTRQIADVADEEITFTNWSAFSNSLTDNCVSIDARNGSWIPDKCNNLRKVICQTSSYTTSSRPTSEDATLSAANVDTQILLVAALIGGLCVIVILVISIVIAVLVVRKYYVRRANASSNSAETDAKSYQDLKTIRRQSNPDGAYTELQLQPVYDEVAQRGC